MKKIFLSLLVLQTCLLSCVNHPSQVQQKLLSYVKDYRQQVYPDINESDSLFYLILFYQHEGNNEILMNANEVEIPSVLRTPPYCGDEEYSELIVPIDTNEIEFQYVEKSISNEGNTESLDSFCGYAEIDNNFLFFYCSENNREFVNEFIEGLNVRRNIDENTLLAQYHTNEWYLDAESWVFYFEDNCLKKRSQ